MKAILTIILIFCTYTVNYSSNVIKKYSAKGLYMVFYNSAEQVIGEKPYGKDVNIEYDDFFKSYKVSAIYDNGSRAISKFSFLHEKDGVTYIIDESDNVYFVVNNIAQSGKLIFVGKEPMDDEGSTVHFEYRGVVENN